MTVATGAFGKLAERFPPSDAPWEGEGRQAGVLVALTDESEPRVVLGRRAQHLPLHPGEVAFPGGKREPEDHSPWDTALREAEEEVALPPERVRPLAQFAPLVTRSNFSLYPCIALIPASVELRADPAEFDSLLLPGLRRFAERERFRMELAAKGDQRVWVPHYLLGEDSIWGVTAAALAQLVNVVYDAGLDLRRNWRERP